MVLKFTARATEKISCSDGNEPNCHVLQTSLINPRLSNSWNVNSLSRSFRATREFMHFEVPDIAEVLLTNTLLLVVFSAYKGSFCKNIYRNFSLLPSRLANTSPLDIDSGKRFY